MLLLKYVLSNMVFVMIFMVLSSVGMAAVLELGESQLHGKKDQPEAMTFVSRAPLDVSSQVTKLKTIGKIKDEINSEIFELEVKE